MNWISGYKTYIIGFLMVVLSGLLAQGYISADVFTILEGILLGGGLAALRAGVAKA